MRPSTGRLASSTSTASDSRSRSRPVRTPAHGSAYRQGAGRWRPPHRRPPAPRHDLHRKGADLERELPITLKEALLGAEVPVRSPKGTVLLRIRRDAARTAVPAPWPRHAEVSREGHGDLYVRAKVILPTDLTDKAKEAARRPRHRRPARSSLIERTKERPQMQLDRFTQKAQEAVIAAQQTAERLHSRSSTPSTCSARLSSRTTASPPKRCAGWASTCPRSAESSRRSSPSVPGSKAAHSRSIPAPSASSSVRRPRHGGSATSTPRPSTCCSAWLRPGARHSNCSSGMPPGGRRSSRHCRASVAVSA